MKTRSGITKNNKSMRHHTEEEYRRARRNLFLILIALAALMWLTSCKQTEYVPVVEKHEVHHHHTDSVKEKDSTYHEKETIIQELDSAAMAKYGIQLKAAERAWLVKTKELEKQLQQLERMTSDRDSVRDSIPVPYPVKEYVDKPLAWYERGLMFIGGSMLILLTAVAIIWRFRKKLIIE